MFSDAEFDNACEEIDSPYLNGWEYFTQSYSGLINIYRQYNEVGWNFAPFNNFCTLYHIV